MVGLRKHEGRAVGPMPARMLDPAVALVIEFVATDLIFGLRGLPDARPRGPVETPLLIAICKGWA